MMGQINQFGTDIRLRGIFLLLVLILSACHPAQIEEQARVSPQLEDGQTYVVINDHEPYFTDEDIMATQAYEDMADLDELGRVGPANAVLGQDLMPEEERGNISSIKPTGWQQAFYTNVPGGALYHRSHLIGHQLTGNDGSQNIMTATQWLNQAAMLPVENFVAAYIESTDNHVRYRVTPVFEGANVLASGIYMEGFSIEDNGEGVQFHIYIPNRQPGVEINYADGSSRGPQGPLQAKDTEAGLARPPEKANADQVNEGDLQAVDQNGDGRVTIQEAKDAGFSMPIHRTHWLYPYMHDADGDGWVGESAS